MNSSDAGSSALNNFSNVASSLQLFSQLQAPLFTTKYLMPDLSAMMPDYNKMMSPLVNSISETLADAAKMAYPVEQLASMQKMILEASGISSALSTFAGFQSTFMRNLCPTLNVMESLGLAGQIESSVAAITQSLGASIETPSYLSDILASASALREELAEEDLEDLTDGFFENHPDLTESLESSPALLALSLADRRLIVWCVRFTVMVSVTCVILSINTEYPELEKMIGALGLSGGWEIGKKAGEYTGGVLDKLPQAESE